MSESTGRTINVWVQTAALIGAGLWGAYTFVYLNITKPAAAPINLSTEVALRDAGKRAPAAGEQNGRPMVAIELQITASNPSTRTVHVLPNYWVATGMRVGARNSRIDWVQLANQNIAGGTPNLAGEHYVVSGAEMVAAGTALVDSSLKPNERVSQTIVFFIPEGAYDVIDVEAVVPSSPVAGGYEIDWTLGTDGSMTPKVRAITKGEARELSEEEFAAAHNDTRKGLQSNSSRAQLSLARD